jgi:hypothetical protein
MKVAINGDSPDVGEQLPEELIDRIDIGPEHQAQRHFWVPNEQRPGHH